MPLDCFSNSLLATRAYLPVLLFGTAPLCAKPNQEDLYHDSCAGFWLNRVKAASPAEIKLLTSTLKTLSKSNKQVKSNFVGRAASAPKLINWCSLCCIPHMVTESQLHWVVQGPEALPDSLMGPHQDLSVCALPSACRRSILTQPCFHTDKGFSEPHVLILIRHSSFINSNRTRSG